MFNLNVLAICGSLRKHSTNQALLNYALKNAPEGMSIVQADLMQIPFYNADIEEKPQSVIQLIEQAKEADAFLLVCPEYNYSIAPALKNALDWLSREPNNSTLKGKTAAIMGSAGGMGSSRAQYHLRQVCVVLDLHLVNKPEVFCNAYVAAFDDNHQLADERIQQLIVQQLSALAALTEQMAPKSE